MNAQEKQILAPAFRVNGYQFNENHMSNPVPDRGNCGSSAGRGCVCAIDILGLYFRLPVHI